MPAATSVGKAKLDLLYRDASASAVSLIRYSKESKSYIDFGSGFVLYDDSIKTVILTSAEVFDEDEEDIIVCFSNGETKQASVFVSDVSSIYTSLVVDSIGSSNPVVFSRTVARGELVFTVSRVLAEITRPGIYTGSVIHPRCVSVSTHSGKPVNKYDDLFALSCPVAGPCGELQRPATMEALEIQLMNKTSK
ncbi:uncharacterized protein [Miscanthus floridulus]|uniref:uncharacterized protein isoform X2 n=1 Tax=Miscanthus floridulus TaxID=154761 RepID=UPI00345A586E